MEIPRWVTLLVGVAVIGFGIYRLRMAQKGSPQPVGSGDPQGRPGLGGLSRRRHFLFGIVYLIMGGLLIATSFGFRVPIFELFGR